MAENEKVSLAKGDAPTRQGRPNRAGRTARPDVARVVPPRTIDLAALAGAVLVLSQWVHGLGMLGNDSTLLKYVKHANATAKSPDKNFDAVKAVHSLRVGGFLNAVIVTVVVLLLVWALRRTRSASTSRWGVLIFFVLLQLPFYVVPTKGLPPIAQTAGVVTGVAAIAMIVLVFLPQSAQYFRECRDAVTPPELRGQPRPGLGSLFKPRPPAGGAGARPAATRAATTRPAAKSSASKAKAKAKVRSDAEAVARGAELARSRAKSTKSRRSE